MSIIKTARFVCRAALLFVATSIKMPTHGGKEITFLDLATHAAGFPGNPDNMTGATVAESAVLLRANGSPKVRLELVDPELKQTNTVELTRGKFLTSG